MRRIGGNEMRESGREDIGSVTNSAATLVDEFQLLAFFKGKEVGDKEPSVFFKINLWHVFLFAPHPRSSSRLLQIGFMIFYLKNQIAGGAYSKSLIYNI